MATKDSRDGKSRSEGAGSHGSRSGRVPSAAQTSDPFKAPPLDFAETVTREHGDTFAEEWWDRARDGEMAEAFRDTRVILRPESNEEGSRDRYMEIMDEICTRTFQAAKAAISAAFVEVASAVIERVRRY